MSGTRNSTMLKRGQRAVVTQARAVDTTKKIAVLHRIAQRLSPDVRYPEKALNEIIATLHPDTAAIRRHMIEYGILERNSGSVYWIKDGE